MITTNKKTKGENMNIKQRLQIILIILTSLSFLTFIMSVASNNKTTDQIKYYNIKTQDK
jgi:hypothetical protein